MHESAAACELTQPHPITWICCAVQVAGKDVSFDFDEASGRLTVAVQQQQHQQLHSTIHVSFQDSH